MPIYGDWTSALYSHLARPPVLNSPDLGPQHAAGRGVRGARAREAGHLPFI